MAVSSTEAGSIPGIGGLTGKARKEAVFKEVRRHYRATHSPAGTREGGAAFFRRPGVWGGAGGLHAAARAAGAPPFRA